VETRSRVTRVAELLRQRGTERTIVRLIGPHEGARREASEIMADALGRRLINVDLNDLGTAGARIPALVRDAMLARAIVAVHVEPPRESEEPAVRTDRRDRRLDRLFDVFGDLLFVLGPHSATMSLPADARLWHVDLPAPGFDVRKKTWEAALEHVSSGIDIGRVADTFRFGQEQIKQTVGLAANLASLREPPNPTPSTREVLDAGRLLTTPELHRFAIRIEPRYRWPDIVLPPEKTDQLRRLASWVRYRHLVHEQWGFGQKLSRGKGLNVLFSGPPGTGKTMAAEILAGELGLDLYQIDLSTVVSKYIGQTEKQLNSIFKEAEDSQVVLCFDEADALFGKRTEVKDAHDRYANIEVNYLLQRVEQYEGMVILATNLQRNLDEAFMRRLHVIDFPPPNEERRLRIWQTHFPKEAQCGTDIDLPFLASKFKVNGGTIKNIVLAAAFRAADEQQPIGMAHLIHATKEELQKQGKLPVKADFDRYYELIQPKEPVV
jgi:SpoVK/Ycf46/Vps4 family AAA+-type ATPase